MIIESSGRIKSIDLLHKILELSEIYHSPEEWYISKYNEDSDSFKRLKQIQILLNLYLPELTQLPLHEQINAVLYGSFIQKREIAEYVDLYDEMKVILAELSFKKSFLPEINFKYLETNYRHALIFKKYIQQWKVVSPVFKSSIKKVDYSSYLIEKVFIEFEQLPIDSFLGSVIDPRCRDFDKRDLMSNYNYPQ